MGWGGVERERFVLDVHDVADPDVLKYTIKSDLLFYEW